MPEVCPCHGCGHHGPCPEYGCGSGSGPPQDSAEEDQAKLSVVGESQAHGPGFSCRYTANVYEVNLYI